ncbi:MAG: UDP-N-acetylglucosamine 4,6-dehydratase (inverting) [Alphaproteobacteria bacterium]|nr:UDP-N-acetylglucosamine 4,6-dehydratase (inverting) [Alphaproteobacteria bacterium]
MTTTAKNSPNLDGASILVTGGTGSFGRRFIRTVLERYKPERLIVFSRDEQKQYEMANDRRFQHPALRYFIGDVRDGARLEMAMRGIDYVVHAAALKHVPTAEYNPFECIRTNVHGAENVVTAALRTGVRRIVALSTDKAANPVNLYGASKLASDKIFVAANNLSAGSDTRFSVVRYGNVVGSRGSVVPLFERWIAEKADHLPVTDPRMTRFWITLQHGVDFVLSSLAMMQGGEIFVPKIASMKIVDMVEAMAPGMKIRVVGIRPGEKLHETLITRDEARSTYELHDRYVIAPAFHFWSEETHLADGAKRTPEDFDYTSDGNTQWLDPAALKRLLSEPRD